MGYLVIFERPPSMNELLYVANIQEYGAMYGSFIGIISDLWRQNIIYRKASCLWNCPFLFFRGVATVEKDRCFFCNLPQVGRVILNRLRRVVSTTVEDQPLQDLTTHHNLPLFTSKKQRTYHHEQDDATSSQGRN